MKNSESLSIAIITIPRQEMWIWETIKVQQKTINECIIKLNRMWEIAKQSANARILCLECERAKNFSQSFIYMWFEMWKLMRLNVTRYYKCAHTHSFNGFFIHFCVYFEFVLLNHYVSFFFPFWMRVFAHCTGTGTGTQLEDTTHCMLSIVQK